MKMFFRLTYVIYLLGIIVVSISPSVGIGKIDTSFLTFRIDYPLHVLAFIPLPILAFLSNGFSCTSFQWKKMLVLSTVIALGAEFIQILVPSRTFNPIDLLCNVLGLSIGILIARIWERRNIQKRKINI
ncbi:MAG: VanZ family protein [Bacteroidales bacterium]|jgi:glycopeptide antibiotics resistance protein|nr:VanZ family protein [Bacteroidales bacterium]MDD4672384.1 VanZ family protein [Bacteroidales bacterium]MDY0347457.1 VanZ family protein [Tenuifilaceae bacterium]